MTKPKREAVAPRDRARPKSRSQKLKIAIVGAGRLGTALGVALAESGIQVMAVVCRRKNHAKSAARIIGPQVIALSAEQYGDLPACDVVVIATSDDAIASTAAKLTAERDLVTRSLVLLHVSGSLSSTILRASAPPNWSVGSIHPLLAVSDARAGAAGLHSAFFCIEGEPPALRTARRLVRELGATAVSVRTRQKALYHAAAVMAAGHAVALFDLAVTMLARSGPSPAVAAQMLYSLMQSAIRELDHGETRDLMTGPFARGDVSTIERHLAALSGRDLIEARAAYVALGRHAIGLAEAKGIGPSTIRRMRDLLTE